MIGRWTSKDVIPSNHGRQGKGLHHAPCPWRASLCRPLTTLKHTGHSASNNSTPHVQHHPFACLLRTRAGRYSYEERQERSETSRTDFGNYYYEWKQRQPTMRIVDSGATVDCSGSVYDEYDYQYCNAAGCYGDTLTGRQDKQSSCTTYRFYAFPGNVFAW